MRHSILVSELKTEVDPAEVGLDAERLRRIDSHFKRYVDDGRLPGWLITVSRHGRLAHVSCYGRRDAEAGLPVEPDTLWRIYSMTKPVTSVAAMGGAASTAFWIDPAEELTVSFYTQLIPSSAHPIRPQLRQLVYQSLT